MKLRTLLPVSIFLAMFSLASAEPLKVGDAAPDATAITETGAKISLAEVYKKQPYTLVYFYPKADTPGCTKQGCSLRDVNAELTKKGVAILGVSTDSTADQKAFKDKYNFPFPLIADTDKAVIKAFGQAGTNRASREAYLIKDGKIVYKDTGVTEKQGENILAYLSSVKN